MGILSGNRLSGNPEMPPLDTDYSLVGSREMGPDWDFAMLPGRLIVGSPAEATVRAYPLEEETELAAEDSLGIIEGENALDGFGSAVTVVSDFDGDGTPDLVIGAPTLDSSTTTRQDGAVYLMSGLGAGFKGKHFADKARVRINGEDVGGRFGDAISACGDVDGDGLDDFVVAATWDQSGAPLAGRVVLALSSRLSDLGRSVQAGAVGPTWVGAQTGERVGQALSCKHDLNGDGIVDILIGAPFADASDGTDGSAGAEAVGKVYRIIGGEAPVSGPLFSVSDRIIQESQDEAWFGWSIATGDLNGDGRYEVIVGAPGADEGTGRVHIWDGQEFIDQDGGPRFVLTGAHLGEGFGRSVTAADIDGDGIDDLVVGAPFLNPTDEDTAYDSGALYIYMGAEEYAGWPITMSAEDANVTVSQAQQYLRTGQKVRTSDVDGDGRLDLGILHRAEPE